MKIRLTGAKKGYSLLKKKSDALMSKFRKIVKELKKVCEKKRKKKKKIKTLF